jgi:hypothetical protein
MHEIRNAYKSLAENSLGGQYGIYLEFEDKGCEIVNWIHLPQDNSEFV